MPVTHRHERVNHTLQREIGAVIAERLADPRLPKVTSVTHVECSGDMREAMVSISVLGPPNERRNALVALESAAGLIRHELGERVHMKHIPRLQFKLDTRMAEAQDTLSLLDSVSPRARKRAPTAGQKPLGGERAEAGGA